METSHRESLPNPRVIPKRYPSPPPPSSRITLPRLHSHSRSLDAQHDAVSRSSQVNALLPAPEPETNRSNKTSRIMSSVKRSISGSYPPTPKKQLPVETTNVMGMYSTPAERTVQHSARIKRQDPYSSPPSIEQIAMGLHISRTPHFRPPSVPNHPFSQRHVTIPPPPPSRSAMKKPGKASSSSPSLEPHSISSTTVTSSNLPSTPRSNRSLLSLKLRMSRLLPSPQSSVPSTTLPSPTASSVTNFVPPKKAVRFSTSTLDLSNREDE
ncbi:hypothetical protein J3R30DRAFT_3551232 [Lentinula aciculospora]|uniref:Uncharacterized protein n=1 Tax=Lentinula aciculospora TaxID=153920 RepID=A0A9W8ZXH0_9AGAR|nr:hypothetical protein J3R30DRAFT_3551232 [Lentinula aciculospora]